MIRHLDLFSGIGGFALAARRVWGDEHEVVSFCEMDEFCGKVLNKHWPGVPVVKDIREFDATKYSGTIDLISGGFPCQPFSVAGKRKGTDDSRHLWPEMLRVIRECQPAYILGENVPGIRTSAIDLVLSDLEEAGYSAEPLVVGAWATGAPHKRERVWIVAVDNTRRTGTGHQPFPIGGPQRQPHYGLQPEALRQGYGALRTEGIDAASNSELDHATGGRRATQGCGLRKGGAERVRLLEDATDFGRRPANTMLEINLRWPARPGEQQYEWEAPRVMADAVQQGQQRQRRPSRTGWGAGREGQSGPHGGSGDAETTMQWQVESGLGQSVNGLSRRLAGHRVAKLKALGNAIVPQVACMVLSAMKEYDPSRGR